MSRSATAHSATAQPLIAGKARALSGRLRVPGDKSISHRALLIGALAIGRTEVEGLLEGEDVIATARAVRAMGAAVERLREGNWRVQGLGVGTLLAPKAPLDFGNAGTGSRLTMGVVAGHPFEAVFDGDASLRKRPMRRILDPLIQMGAEALEQAEGGRLPLRLRGVREPIPISYETLVPSAQVKSAVLLCGLSSAGATTVIEREATRDHTERMLAHFGAEISSEPHGEHGRKIVLKGRPELVPQKIVVPSDISSAAFPLVASLIVPGSDIVLENVLLNPLRAGLVETLREMGGNIEEINRRDDAGEIIADLRVRASHLKGVDVPAARAPSMIDEYIVLAVAASFAEGETRMRGLSELRVKESDRLAATAAGLRVNGVDCEIEGDDLIVRGKGSAAGGGLVETHMDHRLGMAFLVMGLASQQPVKIDDSTFIATSFPGFTENMCRLGADIFRMIVTVDGPAASGKGTLARRLAAHYGLPHLDTGLLYRGVGFLMLERNCALDDEQSAEKLALELDLKKLDHDALRSRGLGEAASRVASMPKVRAALLKMQQDFANQPGGAVLDGRDMGTVIAPRADVKIFVTATPEERARRRHIELAARRDPVEYCEVISDIKKRDERDSERAIAPLKPAPDAVLLDTTQLDIEAAFRAALSIVEASRAGRARS